LISYFSSLTKRSVRILIDLLPLVLAAMLLVRVGEQFGLSDGLAALLAPLMQLVGLPAETGIVWALTLLTGIYGGAGVYLSMMPSLDITVAQHSILCSMMLFAHALPVEQVVVHRVGANGWVTGAFRVVAAVVYGVVANWFCVSTGFLSQKLESPAAKLFTSDPGWLDWLFDTALYVVLLSAVAMRLGVSVPAVVAALLVLMDALKKIGLIDILNAMLRPLLGLVGIERQLAPVATTGVLLGVVYGGALMLDEVRSGEYTKRSIFSAMLLVCLVHALIEDTLVLLAIGANIWIILIGRVLFSIVLLFVVLRLSERLQRS
jgi:hypothetical protein